MATTTLSLPAENPEPKKKKKSLFHAFSRKKGSKKTNNAVPKGIGPETGENTTAPTPGSPPKRETSSTATAEMVDRAKVESRDYSTSRAKEVSSRNLIAMAYHSTTTKSFRARPGSAVNRFSGKSGAIQSLNETDLPKTDSKKGGGKLSSFLSFTGTAFFRKICDDVFDSIDVDRSGKIDESELYQGLLLVHLKLGMYFGTAACKPISLERTKFIFEKLDTNSDGMLDKSEFRNVLTLLMGNVVFRIVFQLVSTLVVVPLGSSKILEKAQDAYGYIYDFVTQSLMPILQQYRPLLEMATGWDLVSKFGSAVYSKVDEGTRETWIKNLLLEYSEGPIRYLTEKYGDYVLKPLDELPQETWDSMPLTFVSTILTLIIVPFVINKTDDVFRYLANYAGGKDTSKKS